MHKKIEIKYNILNYELVLSEKYLCSPLLVSIFILNRGLQMNEIELKYIIELISN